MSERAPPVRATDTDYAGILLLGEGGISGGRWVGCERPMQVER